MNLDDFTKKIFMGHVEQRKLDGVDVLKLDMRNFEEEMKLVFVSRLGRHAGLQDMGDFKQGSLSLVEYFEKKSNLMDQAGVTNVQHLISFYINGLRPEIAKFCETSIGFDKIRSVGELWKIMKDADDHVRRYKILLEEANGCWDGRTKHPSSHESSSGSSRESHDSSQDSKTSSIPFCKFHPNKESHWTRDCTSRSVEPTKSNHHDYRHQVDDETRKRDHDSKTSRSESEHETPKRKQQVTKPSKKNHDSKDSPSGKDLVLENKGDFRKPSSPQ